MLSQPEILALVRKVNHWQAAKRIFANQVKISLSLNACESVKSTAKYRRHLHRLRQLHAVGRWWRGAGRPSVTSLGSEEAQSRAVLSPCGQRVDISSADTV